MRVMLVRCKATRWVQPAAFGTGRWALHPTWVDGVAFRFWRHRMFIVTYRRIGPS